MSPPSPKATHFACHPSIAAGVVLRYHAAANVLSVRDTLIRVERDLIESGVTRDNLSTILIVVSEVLNNIAEHGYQGVPPGGFVLRGVVRADHAVFGFHDTGSPLPEHLLAEDEAEQLPTELPELPEGGYGWSLIRTLAAKIRHRYTHRGNWLLVRINLVVA